MKTTPSIFVLIFSAALANTANSQTLSCMDTHDGIIIFHTNTPERRAHIKNTSSNCASGFTFIQDRNRKMSGYIITPPKELGLNAKQSVYYTPFNKGANTYIGELPSSANENEEGLFINVLQQGGSIYLEKYKLTPTKIEASPETLELLVDGIACIQNPSDVWQITFHGNRVCNKKAKASSKHPICLSYNNGKATLSPLSICKVIQENREK